MRVVTPESRVRAWVAVVAVAGMVATLASLLAQPPRNVDAAAAIVLCLGVAGAILTPIRYRLGSDTH
ncbi:MAG: hypothetical protein ACI867_000397, partial [Glaciecola sp.]